MPRSKKKRPAMREDIRSRSILLVVLLPLIAFGVYHFVYASFFLHEPITIEVDPNLGIKAHVEEFFRDNEAEEMLPIIACESRFRHFEPDGTVLKNRKGSSAIGVAQILSSVHPDPKVLDKYNKQFNTDLTVDDFDLENLYGNIGYALVLYEVRGVKDWECAKKFRF